MAATNKALVKERTYKNKIENCRFVTQKCNQCGEEFVLIYWYNEKVMFTFSKPCHCNASFHPVDGPTFAEWHEAQTKLRELVAAMG